MKNTNTRIVFLNGLNDYWLTKINELEKEFPETQFIKNDNRNDRLKLLETADAVISGRLNADEITNAPKLIAVFVPFTGLDNFPLQELKQRNILISNTHANAKVVAERAIALTFALLGRIVELHNDLKKGYWHLSTHENDMWISLQEKSCGIFGLGKIGLSLAKFLKAFDCKVYGFKKHVENFNNKLVDYVSDNIEDIVSKSEIIYNCLPLTDETKNIVNKKIIGQLNGKYYVTIGRGETTDEEALYLGLKNGILKGAAIDVWYKYPGKERIEPTFPSSFPIYELPNLVLSPHKSSHTIEAINSMIDDTCENIRSFILSGIPKNISDKEY